MVYLLVLTTTYLSRVPAKMYLPFGENLTNETGGFSSSTSVLRHWPELVSHIRLQIGEIQWTVIHCLYRERSVIRTIHHIIT